MSHLLTGVHGWTDYDRLLVLALTLHDRDICPSGAGPVHYTDECDADTSDIDPEPFERTCVYLKASEDWQDERAQEKNPERGILVGFTDSAAGADADPAPGTPAA